MSHITLWHPSSTLCSSISQASVTWHIFCVAKADCKARAEKAAKSTHWTTQDENHIEAGWTSRHEAMEALDIEWMLDGIDKMDQDSEGLDHFLANTESEIDEGFAEDLPEGPLSEFA